MKKNLLKLILTTLVMVLYTACWFNKDKEIIVKKINLGASYINIESDILRVEESTYTIYNKNNDEKFSGKIIEEEHAIGDQKIYKKVLVLNGVIKESEEYSNKELVTKSIYKDNFNFSVNDYYANGSLKT
ncbi:MAG: hypothetical protein ACRC0V_04295, partial [Fusobacteriaceae bacterium]